MRITQSMLSQDFLRQLNNSYNKLSDMQQQLYTGKKITRPSQDPVVATLGIAYRTDTAHVDQFKRNMDNVHKWIDNSDAALDQANSVMQRVRELVVEGSNGTYTDDQRKDIQKEVEQLKAQLVTISNTQVGGQYIFNGTNTSTPPVTLNDDGTVTTDYNSDEVKIEVNDGIMIGVNVNPSEAFPQELFDHLKALGDALSKDGSDGKEIGAFLDKIDGDISKLVGTRSELGARENRVDMIDNRIDQQKQIATNIMSKNEDVEFEKVLIAFQTQQSVHNAALSVGARIIQPTLVDFLR